MFFLQQTEETKITLKNLKSGIDYQVRIRAKTSAGFGPYSSWTTVHTAGPYAHELPENEQIADEPTEDNIVIIIAAVCAVVFVALLIFIVIRYRRTGKLLCLNTSRVPEKQPNSIKMRDDIIPRQALIGKKDLSGFSLACINFLKAAMSIESSL